MRSSLKTLAILAGLTLVVATSAQADSYTAVVSLVGSQEVPPSGSAALGHANICIDTDANTVTYNMTHNVANQTAAHFHGFVGPGTNAGVVFGIGVGGQMKGTWTYTEGQQANILAGLTYLNVHSSAFPGGEIRGQVVPVAGPCTSNPLPATSNLALMIVAGLLLAAGTVIGARRARA